MTDDEYSLADLERITGAKRRSIQLWADAGVLEARPSTNREGSGTHRRFSRDEAIVACVVHPFAARHMSIGELMNVAGAVRAYLTVKRYRERFERAIANETIEYLLLATSEPGKWACALAHMRPQAAHRQEDLAQIGEFTSDMLDRPPAPGKVEAMIMTVSLNTCLAGMS